MRADARAKIILERQRAYDAKLAARKALIAKRKEAADKCFFERDALNKLKAQMRDAAHAKKLGENWAKLSEKERLNRE